MADRSWSPTRGYFKVGEAPGGGKPAARAAADPGVKAEKPAAAAASGGAGAKAGEAAKGGGGWSPARGGWSPTRGAMGGGSGGAAPAPKEAPAKAAPREAPARTEAKEPPAPKETAAAAVPAAKPAAARAAAAPKAAARAPEPPRSDPLKESVTTVPGLAEASWSKAAGQRLYTEPDSETTLYRVTALNALFAVSSALLLIALCFVMWEDYARPWKDIQAHWQEKLTSDLEAKLAAARMDGARKLLEVEPEVKAILSALLANDTTGKLQAIEAEAAALPGARLPPAPGTAQAAGAAAEDPALQAAPARVALYVSAAREALDGMDEYGTLSHDAAEAKKDFSFAETELRDFRGDYQAEKFQFEERKREALVLWGDTAEGWAEVARIAREFEETYDRDLEKLAAKVERLDIEANDRAKQLAAYVAAHAAATNGKTLTDLEGRLSEIEQGTTEIAKQIAALEANWRQALRNAPVLDALAPSYKIEKVVTPDLHEDLNFLTVPRIDRCKTCHINIDDPTPEYASLPPDADWGTVYRSHPRLDLFLGSASPHPYETFGCTVCHNGDGHATDFTRAAHTPRDDEQKHHWEEKYDWHKLKYQDFPMPPRKYIYFSCLKCHPHDHALDGGGQYNRGYELVQKYGCFGCHKIDAFEGAEKVGPSLTHIADKVDAAFLYKWIRNPRHFRNSTRMPRFFDLTNSVGSMDIQGPREGEIVSMDFAARNGIEALALATYLHEKSDRRSDLVRLEATGDPARGRELFRQTGCLGCHSIKRESQASAGPSATMAGPEDLGALTRSALAALGSGEPTAAPSPAVEAVREALVALERWFDRLPVADRLEERYHELAAAIEKLEKDTASGVPAETAAPAGVHPPSLQAAKAAASGFYNRWVHETFAPDLSSIGSKVTNPDWLADWILDPRRHDPKTVMPRFRLQADADGKQKIADLVAYLLSLRDPEFDGSEVFAVDEAGEAEILDAMVFDYKRRDVGREMARQEIERLTAGGAAGLNHKLVYLGHRLIRRYGCFGCHNGIKDIDSKVPGATFDAAMPIGTELNEWGIKEVKKLDYGNWGHQHDGTYAIAQTRHAWAEAKLTNTRRFDVLPTKKYAGEEGGEYWPTNRLVQKTPEELLKMPLFGFAEEREEVEAVVTFLLSLARKDEVPLGKIHRLDEEKKALETGSRLIAKFNCKGCHRIGAEKQTVPIERLPHFSLTDEGEEIGRRNNLEQETWLARPAKLRGGTRPGDPKKLGLDVRPGTLISKQVFDASTMEEGKDEPVSLVELAERDFALRGVAERDRVLRVAGYEEGQMRFYFGISPDSRFQAPPPLVREGERVRGDWLLRFLTNVTTIRPWLKVRMPSFHLTQDEARAIVRWFKTSAGVPFGGELFSEDLHDHELARRGADVFGPPVAGRTDRLQCNSCHPSGEVLPTLPVLTPPAGKETDPAWTFGWRAFPFAVPEESYYVVWKGPAGFEHQAGFPGRDEARAWGESKLAGGGTPWAVGDPWSKATWGPDLGLAAERLRPGWIRLWLRNPPDFMPGTKMPNFFGGEDPISGHPLDRTGATDQEKSAIAEGRRRIEALIQYLVHMKVVDGLAQK